MHESVATYLRILITIGVVLTAVVFVAQVLLTWRRLSYGQKMLAVAVASYLIYIADANRAALDAGLQWNWRLAPLGVGLASFTAYLMEPWSIKKSRIGRRGALSGPDKERLG